VSDFLSWNVIITAVTGGLLGFMAGLLAALFGAGGGIIIVPALNIIGGVPMNITVGTSSLQIVFASVFSIFKGRPGERLAGWPVALWTGAGIPAGAFLGAGIVSWLKTLGGRTGRPGADLPDMVLLGVAEWLIADTFFLTKKRPGPDSSGGSDARRGLWTGFVIPPMIKFRAVEGAAFSAPALMFLGVCVGFLGGLLGIGGGVIMMPAMYYLVGVDTKISVRISLMLIFMTGLLSSFFHFLSGNINLPLAAALIAGAWFGSSAGTALLKRLPGGSIRKYFAFVLIAGALVSLLKVLFIARSL
jgi:uncharacterized membrane protein YfcA